jgi:hypothetical protein
MLSENKIGGKKKVLYASKKKTFEGWMTGGSICCQKTELALSTFG